MLGEVIFEYFFSVTLFNRKRFVKIGSGRSRIQIEVT